MAKKTDPAVADVDASAPPEPVAAVPQDVTGLRAVVKVEFTGAPDGQVYPRAFAPGDVVEGSLAAVALREGWAEAAG